MSKKSNQWMDFLPEFRARRRKMYVISSLELTGILLALVQHTGHMLPGRRAVSVGLFRIIPQGKLLKPRQGQGRRFVETAVGFLPKQPFQTAAHPAVHTAGVPAFPAGITGLQSVRFQSGTAQQFVPFLL